MTRPSMPISAAVRSFFFTYETEAGSSPTRTRTMQGLRPERRRHLGLQPGNDLRGDPVAVDQFHGRRGPGCGYFSCRLSTWRTMSLPPGTGFTLPYTTTSWSTYLSIWSVSRSWVMSR